MNGICLKAVKLENLTELCELERGGFEIGSHRSNWQAVAESQFYATDLVRGIYRGSDAIGLLWIGLTDSAASNQNPLAKQSWSRAVLRRLMLRLDEDDFHVARQAFELACRQVPNVVTVWGESNSAKTAERLQSLGFVSNATDAQLVYEVPPLADQEVGQPFLDASPGSYEVVQVERELESFNRRETGRDDFQPLNLVYRNSQGSVVAGLKSVSGWEWLYIQVLWVAEQDRGRGLGSRLLAEAEATARRRGCRGACLSSFSFQAPEFYRKLGYEECGAIEDYPLSHTMHFFAKRWG